MGAGKESYTPAHQNKVKFAHNPKSQLTKKIMAIEHDCICERCVQIIDWRKTFRKYKPLKELRRCNDCLNKTINRAYHTICEKCAREKGICAKCLLPCEASLRPKKVTDEEVLNCLNNSGMKERLKRSLMRNWENGLLRSEDVVTVVNADANGTSIDWTKLLVEEPLDDEGFDYSDDDARDMGVSSGPKKKPAKAAAKVTSAATKTDSLNISTPVSIPSPGTEKKNVVENNPVVEKKKTISEIKAEAGKVTKTVKVITKAKVIRGHSSSNDQNTGAVAVTQMMSEFKISD